MPGPNWEAILKNTTAEIDSLTPPTEEMETRTMEISTKERELNANGYILKVAVYYDDVWKEQFKENAETRIDAIMALVDEQYSENTFAVFLIMHNQLHTCLIQMFYRLKLMLKWLLLSMPKVKTGIGNGTQVKLEQFCVIAQAALMETLQQHLPMM